MQTIASGSATAFFLYDVGEGIDLGGVRTLVDATVRAPLTPTVTPQPYIQYQQPPITIEGRALGMADIDGFRVRFKAFDYGVVSVALTRDLTGTWDALLQQGLKLHDNSGLAAAAERLCRDVIGRMMPAITRPR